METNNPTRPSVTAFPSCLKAVQTTVESFDHRPLVPVAFNNLSSGKLLALLSDLNARLTLFNQSSQLIMTVPRPSASLILVNAKNEVLMVQRNPDSRSFAGAHVSHIRYVHLLSIA